MARKSSTKAPLCRGKTRHNKRCTQRTNNPNGLCGQCEGVEEAALEAAEFTAPPATAAAVIDLLLPDHIEVSAETVAALGLRSKEIWLPRSVATDPATAKLAAKAASRRATTKTLQHLAGHDSWAVVAAVAANPRTSEAAINMITDRVMDAMYGPNAVDDVETFAASCLDIEATVAALELSPFGGERMLAWYTAADPETLTARTARMAELSAAVTSTAYPQAVAEFVADGRLDASEAPAALAALTALSSRAWNVANAHNADMVSLLAQNFDILPSEPVPILSVDQAELAATSTDPGMLDRLASSRYNSGWKVRSVLAANPHTPPMTLDEIAAAAQKDILSCETVKEAQQLGRTLAALAAHAATLHTTMERFASTPLTKVRSALKRTNENILAEAGESNIHKLEYETRFNNLDEASAEKQLLELAETDASNTKVAVIEIFLSYKALIDRYHQQIS